MAATQPARRKHTPQRTCIVCRGQFDKRRLTRIVRTPDAGVLVDPTGKRNGRGAYLCDQPACWAKVIRHAGILNQALNAAVTEAELAAIAADPRRPTGSEVE
ncbi:conserved protein of unknown function [Candidatus Promineifilum breve]|uniref:YlxR domain-containing protein n=1 Tax=Candidatus Promineifilum breve TaxID=1806508 RepID=A0A160T244_9CHLR|nr:YlxR family protein [Candidatus Promineifilum breve]CUS03976.2 conserved protein of unknown function [Candidatus Promineifilum breve]